MGKRSYIQQDMHCAHRVCHKEVWKRSSCFCKTYHASGDADLLIVQESVESASAVNTLLIGDDTDLLILLIDHASLCKTFTKTSGQKHC